MLMQSTSVPCVTNLKSVKHFVAGLIEIILASGCNEAVTVTQQHTQNNVVSGNVHILSLLVKSLIILFRHVMRLGLYPDLRTDTPFRFLYCNAHSHLLGLQVL